MSMTMTGCIVLALCVAHTAAVFTTTSAATTTMMGTTTNGGYCPSGWGGPFESSCYLLMSDMGNFTEAEDTCVGEGGHLVSISGPRENTFVHNLRDSTNATWIGLYRDASEECSADYMTCNWTWHDGSVPDYFNWATDRDIGRRPCAYMRVVERTWNSDAFCSNPQTYVCEQDVLFPTTTTPETTMTMTTTNGMTSGHTGDMVSMTTSSERTPGGDNGSVFFPIVSTGDIISGFASAFLT